MIWPQSCDTKNEWQAKLAITFDPRPPVRLKGSKKAIRFLLIRSTGSMGPGNRQTKNGRGIKAKHHEKKIHSQEVMPQETPKLEK